MTEKTIVKIICGIFLSIFLFSTLQAVISGTQYRKDLYKQLLNDIHTENWIEAKSKIDNLGTYKDCETLSKTVNFNYYITIGDEEFSQKDYKTALNSYKEAQCIENNNKILKDKIKNTELQVAKLQVAEEKKKLEQERKQKLAQQAKIKERQKQLLDIQPVIKRTFYKIDFIEDKSLNARMYDFYVDYYLWIQLPYDAKESAFKLAVLYAKLKTNEQYSNDDYLFSTKIRNAQTKSVLAEYKAFSGINITQ